MAKKKSSAKTKQGGSPIIISQKAGEMLAIAKKYYDHHSGVLRSSLIGEFALEAGAVTFDGKLNDAGRAEALCTVSAAIAAVSGDGDYAVGCAAAAVGWANGYARSANTLASVLELGGFIADGNRLNDAKELAEYAISIDKDDADFYLTLAHVLNDMGDKEGALAAVESALALDPENNAALILKINLLMARGGGGESVKKIAEDVKKTDGELSKRDRELKKDAGPIGAPNSRDTMEEAKKKFERMCDLEPITPADMLEIIAPSQARQLRMKILTVTAEEKDLGLPVFPYKMLSDPRYIYKDLEGLEKYEFWLIGQKDKAAGKDDPISGMKDAASAETNYNSFVDNMPDIPGLDLKSMMKGTGDPQSISIDTIINSMPKVPGLDMKSVMDGTFDPSPADIGSMLNSIMGAMSAQTGLNLSAAVSNPSLFFSPVSCMLNYNEEISHNAGVNFKHYCIKYRSEINKNVVNKASEKIRKKLGTSGETFMREHMEIVDEMAAASSLPEDIRQAVLDALEAKFDAAYIRYLCEQNAAEEEALRETLPALDNFYQDVRREGERIWEKMLPFARCTNHPDVSVQDLFEYIVYNVINAIDYALGVHRMFQVTYPEVSSEDLIAAEQAVYAAEEYIGTAVQNNADRLKNVMFSVEVGPFEVKFGTTRVELECVAGGAGRISYDWKSKQMELGVGVGAKAKVGVIGGEAKAYVNVVFDTQNGEVADVYCNGGLKGVVGTSEVGIYGRASVANGVRVSSTVTQRYGAVGIEREVVIWKD